MQVVAGKRSAAKAFCQKLHVTFLGFAFGTTEAFRRAGTESRIKI